MLERPKPRLFTFLSVLPAVEKQAMLFNLGASLREVASRRTSCKKARTSAGLSGRDV